MKNLKLTILRVGAGFFAIIAMLTGLRQFLGGVNGALEDYELGYVPYESIAGLDNDLRFLAVCWFIVGVSLAVGAVLPRKKPDFILLGLLVVVLGGFARLYGFLEYGPIPHEYIPITIEFIGGVPLLLLFASWRQEEQGAPAGNTKKLA
ncbi:DUF4345 family protein [Flexibacterium corallicola]|uniref:DUF4345 family protein n=1 Tax=Flexibacterium corallicola TaxID=3037259 RepID=UPI00286F6AC0|nr:DUF4345 family protein [Pseudovibrio sp. M1P-2-3]